jgi:tetratricopeptide (TPR) repeat protein
LGVALAKLPGRTEEAVERFEKALALYPGFPEAHNNLGIVLSSTGRPTLALEQFEDAVRLRPGFADAQRNLGFALLRDPMHGRSEALEHLEAAQRLAPDPALRRALDELERKDTRR